MPDTPLSQARLESVLRARSLTKAVKQALRGDLVDRAGQFLLRHYTKRLFRHRGSLRPSRLPTTHLIERVHVVVCNELVSHEEVFTALIAQKTGKMEDKNLEMFNCLNSALTEQMAPNESMPFFSSATGIGTEAWSQEQMSKKTASKSARAEKVAEWERQDHMASLAERRKRRQEWSKAESKGRIRMVGSGQTLKRGSHQNNR